MRAFTLLNATKVSIAALAMIVSLTGFAEARDRHGDRNHHRRPQHHAQQHRDRTETLSGVTAGHRYHHDRRDRRHVKRKGEYRLVGRTEHHRRGEYRHSETRFSPDRRPNRHKTGGPRRCPCRQESLMPPVLDRRQLLRGATLGGMSVDGILPDDMRRGGSFPSIGADGVSYTWEALQGVLLQAELLSRAGYGSWAWGDTAILRAVQRINALGYPATGDDRWQIWLVNERYGTNFAQASGVTPGKAFGFADWLYGG